MKRRFGGWLGNVKGTPVRHWNACEWVHCNSLTNYEVVTCSNDAYYIAGDARNETRVCIVHAELAREIGAPIRRIET